MSLVDEAIKQLDTALVWLEAPQERKRYPWHRAEEDLLRRIYSRMPRVEVARQISALLQELTGDPLAERTVIACYVRFQVLAMKAYQGEPGEMSLSRAARAGEAPYFLVTKAYTDGELPGVRKGKQVYVTERNFSLWLAKYRERVLAQGEMLNALEGTEILSKQEAMALLRLAETHLTRYLQTGVLRGWQLPGIKPGRPGEWLVSKESAEALLAARSEGRLRSLLDQNPAYVAMRKEMSTQIRDLRRAGRLEQRDPLAEPQSQYHPGCFTVAQVASHTGVSAQVIYQAIASGKIRAESRVVGGRPRYAISPEEARRFAAEVEAHPDEAARRDTNYLRQIAEAGLLTVRDLARRWEMPEHGVLLRVKQNRIANRKWGRYRVFELSVIEAFEADEVARRGQRSGNMATMMDVVVLPSPPAPLPQGEGRTAEYEAALKLVARIDEELRQGIRHYRNRAGELLTTLDEVVRAILGNDLLVPEAAEVEPVVWISSRHNGVYHG
ncbi:MAG: hypothetical protein KJ077_08435 [Anaerolineae bacterium]|nr:hypothetical protein [Anaerolineae bacterium]